MFYIVVFLASLFYGIEPSVISIALNKGLDANYYVLVSSFLCVVYSFVLSIFNKSSFEINIKQTICIIIGSVFYYYMSYALGLCYEIIPVGLTTTIHFTYPTIVYLISVFLFREKVTFRRSLSVVLCLSGLLFLSDFGKGINIKGFLLAFSTACCYALYLLILDRSEVNKLSSTVISMYTSIVCLACSIISISSFDVVNICIVYDESFYIICSSVLLFAAMVLINIGVKKIGSSIASALMVIEPISSLIVSTIIFHYDLSIEMIIGSILIVLSIIIVINIKT